jgi:hypothetical protein
MTKLPEFTPRRWETLPSGQRYCCPTRADQDHAITCVRRAWLVDQRGEQIDRELANKRIVAPTTEETKAVKETPRESQIAPSRERPESRGFGTNSALFGTRRPWMKIPRPRAPRTETFVQKYVCDPGSARMFTVCPFDRQILIEHILVEPIEGWKAPAAVGARAVRDPWLNAELALCSGHRIRPVAAISALMDAWISHYQRQITGPILPPRRDIIQAGESYEWRVQFPLHTWQSHPVPTTCTSPIPIVVEVHGVWNFAESM